MREQQAVLDFLVDRLRQFDGVELGVVYGSFGTPAESATSDVDIYFVPADPAAEAAGFQTIVGDVGYDLWPLGWSRLERIADLEDGFTALLLDARVVLGGADARARLTGLQERCRGSLADPGTRTAAASRLVDRAASTIARADDGDDRIAVADAVAAIVVALAFLRGCYLQSGPGRVLEEGAGFVPSGTLADLRVALTGSSPTTRLRAIRAALKSADALLAAEPTGSEFLPAGDERLRVVTGFYEELHSTLTKIPRAIAAGQFCVATLAAITAVHEIGSHVHLLDTGRWPTDDVEARNAYRAAGLPDLLGSIPDSDRLARNAAQVAAATASMLAARGVPIRWVPTAADLSRDGVSGGREE